VVCGDSFCTDREPLLAPTAFTVHAIFQIRELHDVGQRDGAPLAGKSISLIVEIELAGQDSGCAANNHHSGLRNFQERAVGQMNPKRLEWLILKAMEQVCRRHEPILRISKRSTQPYAEE
jgi:hypothetical protein